MEIVKMSILSVTEGTALLELHLEECAAEFNCPGIAEREGEVQRDAERCRYCRERGAVQVQRGAGIAEAEREMQCMCGQD